MLQEIITYMIIGAAVTLAVLKFIKRFGGKKQKKMKSTSTSSTTSASASHNCSDCSAECLLRDLPKVVIEKNKEACVQIEKKSKLLQS